MTMISGTWGQPDMSTLTPTDTLPSMSSRSFRGRGYDHYVGLKDIVEDRCFFRNYYRKVLLPVGGLPREAIEKPSSNLVPLK